MTVTKKIRQFNKGFTLLELLTVTSIIALLAGILLPSLRIARRQGRSIYCLSNLRQMAISSFNYNMDNDGYFPIAQWSDDRKSYCWDFITYSESGVDVAEPGLLWQGQTIDKVNQCPSYKGSNNWTTIDTYTGYNYNTSYIGHGQGESTTGRYGGLIKPHPVWPGIYDIVMPAKAGKIKTPADCALFGDGHYSGGANKFMRSPDTWDGDRFTGIRSAGTQGYRHHGKTNVARADGHAGSESRYYTDSYDKIYGIELRNVKDLLDDHNKNAKVKIGFLSQNNSMYDLR